MPFRVEIKRKVTEPARLTCARLYLEILKCQCFGLKGLDTGDMGRVWLNGYAMNGKELWTNGKVL